MYFLLIFLGEDPVMRVLAVFIFLLHFTSLDSEMVPDWAVLLKTADAQVQRVCLNNRNGRLVARANCRGARFTPVSAELLEGLFAPQLGPQGPQGPQGPKGEDGGFTPVLPSGELMRGVFQLHAIPSLLNQTLFTAVTYPNELDFVPLVFFRPSNSTPNQQCPGNKVNPDAAPGHLCV